MSFRSRRRMQTRHIRPNAWPPGDHNALVQARKAQHRAARGELPRLSFASPLGPALDAFADAVDLARARIKAAILRSRQVLAGIEQIWTYAAASGIDTADTDYILERALSKARDTGAEPDWKWMRDQIDGQYIRQAINQ